MIPEHLVSRLSFDPSRRICRDIIWKSNLSGGLIVTFFGGTFSEAKLGILLLQQGQFLKCNLDAKLTASSLPQLDLIFARQSMRKGSAIKIINYAQ